MQKTVFIVLTILLLSLPTVGEQIDQFGFYEASFQSAGQYDNPFTDLAPQATIARADGLTWKIPLFWDGNSTWKLRIRPDAPGEWSFTVQSKDVGLAGQTGSFTCVESDRRGSIQQMKSYGHHFATQDGSPFLFWGDTAWGLFLSQEEEQLNRQSVFHYIDKRASEGINVIHAMLLSEAGWGNEGGNPFFDLSQMNINPAYWQEVDARLEYLNKKGLIGGLVLAWGDKQKREPWAWRMFPGVEARKHYAGYIAARYGAYDVYFILAGEWNAEVNTRDNATREAVKAEFFEIGDAFEEADAHDRMIGIHPMTRDGSVREFNAADWMSFGDYQQNYPFVHERLLQSRSFNKPIVNSEYGYFLRDASGDGTVDKHNSFTPDDMRFVTWDIILAGAYPITGYGTTYMGGYRDPGPFNPDDPRNDAWSQQYRFAKEFLAGQEWWKLQPMDELISSTQPRSKERDVEVRMSPARTRQVRRPALTTYWLLADPGLTYVLYARGVTKKIALSVHSDDEGLYAAHVVNPRTGEIKVKGEFSVSDTFKWIPPDNQDWVLLLTSLNSRDVR
ncbi:DUF4038 domain-containing protein [candidate division KSB1 bacterium]|nr:DUF4038 domain-containing protein [candidate division KSB1 bacterium]RQW03000.1 MAG: DUF4038 domain-containing protein [candidate division KSB1 bacterium]